MFYSLTQFRIKQTTKQTQNLSKEKFTRRPWGHIFGATKCWVCSGATHRHFKNISEHMAYHQVPSSVVRLLSKPFLVGVVLWNDHFDSISELDASPWLNEARASSTGNKELLHAKPSQQTNTIHLDAVKLLNELSPLTISLDRQSNLLLDIIKRWQW